MASQQVLKQKNKAYQNTEHAKRIIKEKKKAAEEGSTPQVGGLVLAILLIIILGSAVIQIINNVKMASTFGENAQSE
jgi:uncharacterized membrane protein